MWNIFLTMFTVIGTAGVIALLFVVVAIITVLGLWYRAVARDDDRHEPEWDYSGIDDDPIGDAATLDHPNVPATKYPRYERESMGA